MRVDLKIHSVPYLCNDDKCFYFLDYIEGGYEASTHNSMVLNFKKDIKHKNNPMVWQHREKAVNNFALMLHGALSNIADEITIIPMPTSKSQNSPYFNDRLLATMDKLQFYGNNMYHIEKCLDVRMDSEPSHISGDREQQHLRDNLKYNSSANSFRRYIALIDDVLTTGAHFKVCQQMILENCPYISKFNIAGFFLAKTDHKINNPYLDLTL